MVDAYRRMQANLVLLAINLERGGDKVQRTRRFIEEQVFKLQDAAKAADKATALFVDEQLPKDYARSAGQANEELVRGGYQLEVPGFTGFDRRALRALQERVSTDLAHVREALQTGLVQGLGGRSPRSTIPGTAERVMQALESEGLVEMRDGAPKVRVPSGKFWDVGAYSRMLGRTAIADARRVAFRQRYLQNGVDVVKVVDNGSTHTVCRAWEGELLSLTGATEGLPTVAEARAAGLFHPNCTHRYVQAPPGDQPPIPPGRLAASVPETALPILSRAPRDPRELLRPRIGARERGPQLEVQRAGDVSDAHVAAVQTELDQLPARARALYAANGGTVMASEFVITTRPDLATKQPGGYPPGSTYKQVEAIYSYRDRQAIIGEKGARKAIIGDSENVWHADRTKPALRHEVGHGIDHAMGEAAGGRDFSATPRFQALYTESLRRIDRATPKRRERLKKDLAYYLPDSTTVGDSTFPSDFRGRREAFAEAFAHATFQPSPTQPRGPFELLDSPGNGGSSDKDFRLIFGNVISFLRKDMRKKPTSVTRGE
jgi:hypothetical protein